VSTCPALQYIPKRVTGLLDWAIGLGYWTGLLYWVIRLGY